MEYSTFFDSYSTIKKIGEGGSGIVFLVKNSNKTHFALKELKIKDDTPSIKIKRFKQELYFLLNNKLPHIIKVLDYGTRSQEKNEIPFFVMPYYKASFMDLIIHMVISLSA